MGPFMQGIDPGSAPFADGMSLGPMDFSQPQQDANFDPASLTIANGPHPDFSFDLQAFRQPGSQSSSIQTNFNPAQSYGQQHVPYTPPRTGHPMPTQFPTSTPMPGYSNAPSYNGGRPAIHPLMSAPAPSTPYLGYDQQNPSTRPMQPPIQNVVSTPQVSKEEFNRLSGEVVSLSTQLNKAIEEMATLRRDLMETNVQVEQPPSSGPQRSQKSKKAKKRNTAKEGVVHKTMLSMVGVETTSTSNFVLPIAPQEDLEIPDREETEWTPYWLSSLTHAYNRAYLVAARLACISREASGTGSKETPFTDLPEDEQIEAIKKYWSSLVTRYKAQVDGDVKAKQDAAKERNTKAQREIRLFERMLIAIPQVESDLLETFQQEQIQGLAKLIDMDWLNTLHTDPGAVSLEDWDTRKVELGGARGESAFEMRQRTWKSERFRRLEHLLFKKTREKTNTRGNRMFPIFPGFTENANHSAPVKGRESKQYPWRGCISDKWIEETGCKIDFPEDDESVSILKLDLPNNLFNIEDNTEWLSVTGDEARADPEVAPTAGPSSGAAPSTGDAEE